MDVREANAIIDDYASRLRKGMSVAQQGDGVCVVTPMLNRNNDNFTIYIADHADHGYVMTDLGETMEDLEFSGFKFTNTRIEKVDSILRSFGVARSEKNELFVTGSRSTIPARMNMLMQAMASVDDLYVTSRSQVKSMFAEDIEDWLIGNDIQVVPSPSFTGRSGMESKFDLAIGKSKRSNMRLIKAVNNPQKSEIQNALFLWQDVSACRTDCDGYVFMNSLNTSSGSVSDEVIEAVKAYDLVPVIWGVDEDRYLDALAA
ncbi:DUF1829 domain-containing protein [Olsenella sp. YH-ols2221]|uniref:DUF1829 domain-containing protein n=1 Tax=Olsenella kribbiana TaxID=3115221 RepID=UPI002ED90CFC